MARMQDGTTATPPPPPPQTLRPLGIGDIVDRAISIVRADPKLLFGIAVLPYLVLTVVQLAFNLAFPRITTFTELNFDRFAPGRVVPLDLTTSEIAALAAYGLVVGIASLVVISLQTAALIDAVSKRYLGRPATISESLRAGLRASGRLILAGIVVFLLVIAVFSAGIVGFVVVAALVRNALGVIGAIVVFLALFVAIFFLTASLMPLPTVVTLEGAGPVAAIRRSWSLAGGARWRILGLLLLMSILSSIISLIFTFILLSTIATQGAVRTILQQLVNLAVAAVWAPIQWGAFTLLYYDLRVRKEAFDLQLAAETMPRAT